MIRGTLVTRVVPRAPQFINAVLLICGCFFLLISSFFVCQSRQYHDWETQTRLHGTVQPSNWRLGLVGQWKPSLVCFRTRQQKPHKSFPVEATPCIT